MSVDDVEQEDVRPAPCCGEVVDPDEALDREECPSCGEDLDVMFSLARFTRR